MVVVARTWRETLFSSFALDPNSQPSSHNYYHHLDLTLSTIVLSIPYSVHTVYSVLDRFTFHVHLPSSLSKLPPTSDTPIKITGKKPIILS